MNKKLKQAITIAASLATITVNALAVILPFNNISTAAVSDSFKTYFVPAGYVFSIWGVIYILWMVYSIGYGKFAKDKDSYIDELFPLYLFSCLLNSVWIVLWHYGYFLTTVVVMIALLVTLIMIYQILGKNKPKTLSEKLIVHTPFSVYLAWICVATIANISDVLWLLNWSAFGIEATIWATIMIAVAGLLATIIVFIRKDIAFAAVVVWALTGIAVKFPDILSMKYSVIGAVSLISLSAIVISIPKKKTK